MKTKTNLEKAIDTAKAFLGESFVVQTRCNQFAVVRAVERHMIPFAHYVDGVLKWSRMPISEMTRTP